MGVSAPVKYALHKFAAHLLGSGHGVTPAVFAGLSLLSAAASPLLVCTPVTFLTRRV